MLYDVKVRWYGIGHGGNNEETYTVRCESIANITAEIQAIIAAGENAIADAEKWDIVAVAVCNNATETYIYRGGHCVSRPGQHRGMTVRKLIERLQSMPLDVPIEIHTGSAMTSSFHVCLDSPDTVILFTEYEIR